MKKRSYRQSDFKPGHLVLFGAAAIVLLVYVWTHFHSRRLISVPEARIGIVATITCSQEGVGRKPRMSALGQKQTFAVQNVMSALGQKADMCSATSRCPLCATSGHGHMFALSALLPNVQITSARWAFVIA